MGFLKVCGVNIIFPDRNEPENKSLREGKPSGMHLYL